MNQIKCINDVLDQYKDRPEVQSDIKKVLKYSESYFRFFATSIINRPEESMTPAEKLDAEIDQIFRIHAEDPDAREALVTLNGLLLRTLNQINTDPVAPIEAVKAHIAAHRKNLELQADMKKTAELFMDVITECLHTVAAGDGKAALPLN